LCIFDNMAMYFGCELTKTHSFTLTPLIFRAGTSIDNEIEFYECPTCSQAYSLDQVSHI